MEDRTERTYRWQVTVAGLPSGFFYTADGIKSATKNTFEAPNRTKQNKIDKKRGRYSIDPVTLGGPIQDGNYEFFYQALVNGVRLTPVVFIGYDEDENITQTSTALNCIVTECKQDSKDKNTDGDAMLRVVLQPESWI